jgi:F420-non-reducing hydrogenase iron-sulfur subunit
MDFYPKIVAFLCNWCSYAGADLAGTSRVKYASNIRVIRVMCSGRVEISFVLKAFQEGADGVLICGCHPGDCHYQEGNYKCLKRYFILKNYLKEMGVPEQRIRLEWVSASEGRIFAEVVNSFTDTIRKLGPAKIIESVSIQN